MNFTHVTLGELLSHTNEIIKRNALSILKQLQKQRDKELKQWKLGEPIDMSRVRDTNKTKT